MQAYLCDPKLKDDFIKEIEWHQQQDAIVQRTYGKGSGKNWRGCAVGCSIRSLNRLKHKRIRTNDHAAYETELGIPEWLAHLEDTIFEGLPADKAKEWPSRFSKAIPVGADLQPVKYQFCSFILTQNIQHVLKLDIPDDLKDQVVTSIRGVLDLHQAALRTGIWDEAAAVVAADSAAWSAASSARFADSADYSVFAFETYADKLIELLEASENQQEHNDAKEQ